MTSLTSVDIQGMVTAQGYFQNALDQVNSVYSAMTEEQSTLAANWTGEASTAFGRAFEQYLADLRVVQQQLAGMLEKLSQNTGVYANTSELSLQLTNSFNSSLAGLPGM